MDCKDNDRYRNAVTTIMFGRQAGLIEFHAQGCGLQGLEAVRFDYILSLMNNYHDCGQAALRLRGRLNAGVEATDAQLFEYGRLHAHIVEAGLSLYDIDENLADGTVLAMSHDEIDRLLATLRRVVSLDESPAALMNAKRQAAAL